MISVFALARMAAALPAGRLVNRFGERAVMTVGIVLVAASSVLAAFSGSLAQLIILRGAGGLGSARYSVGAQTLLLASVPRPAGAGSGPVQRRIPSRSGSRPGCRRPGGAMVAARPFLIYGILVIVPAVLTAVTLGGPPGLAGAPSEASLPSAAGGQSLAAAARALRSRAPRSHAFRAAASAAFADGFAAVGVRSAIVPLFVLAVLHRSAARTGIGFVVFAVLNAAVLLPGGWAADARSRLTCVNMPCT